MTRTIGVSAAIALGLAVSLAAQSGSTTGNPPPSTTAVPPPATTAAPAQRPATTGSAADLTRPMTLTGCVMRNPDGSFTLTNAYFDTAAETATPPSSSTVSPRTPTATGTAGTVANIMIVRLQGGELAGHVGHKVQVMGRGNWDAAAVSSPAATTGTPATTGADTRTLPNTTGTGAPPSAATTGADTRTNPPSTASASPRSATDSSSDHLVAVNSVKMLAATCP